MCWGSPSVGPDYGTNSVRAPSSMSPTARRSRRGGLGLLARQRRRYPQPRPELKAATSRRLSHRRSHHQTGARDGEENRQRFQRQPGHRHRRGHDGSTPLPGGQGRANRLRSLKKFANNPAAMAWLRERSHGIAEAAEITGAREEDAPAISRQSGTYSSRMVSSAKFLKCLAPRRRCSTPRIRGLNSPTSFPLR